jgi:hypothetical protein
MFKKIIAHKGFWRSVVILGVIYMCLLFFIQWAFSGFSWLFFTSQKPLTLMAVFIIGVFICGFSVSYAKFWGKLKRDQYRK